MNGYNGNANLDASDKAISDNEPSSKITSQVKNLK